MKKYHIVNECLRSKRVQILLEKPPAFLIRYGTIFLLLFFVSVGVFICYFPYTRNVCLPVNICKDTVSSSHFAKVAFPNNCISYLMPNTEIILETMDSLSFSHMYELKFKQFTTDTKIANGYILCLDSIQCMTHIRNGNFMNGTIYLSLPPKKLIRYIKDRF